MDIEKVSAYELVEKRKIADLNSVGYIMRHKKTKAKVVLLENDDENKVFFIGFRTPPQNSTGVAHILEHSVLCGSQKYPLKDPFVELAKGSLNTFLNAMTYPDKTVYPVASCNDKDFANLMDVYLDAVFHPNIYKEKKIFMQEGWHYHIESPEDEIRYNGVVYNEMKGAFSSPDDILDRTVFNSLYPDNTYSFESGGDPDDIPQLSYEEFLEFHGRYYHPSNSYIYLYGNMDMAEKLQYIDEAYLSDYDYLEIDSHIEPQKPFDKPVYVQKEYSVTEGEEEEGTYLSYNTSVSNSLDKEKYVAFQILDYALCSAPGAPLKQALIDKNIGNDVYSVYENGICQPFFSIIAKGARLEQRQEFEDTVKNVLTDLVQNGVNKKSLQAALCNFEFKYKEADFGSYPKGLMYGLQALDSWLYDENKPFIHIEANDTFRILKEKIDTDYFEGLIREYILENPHAATVVVVPVKGLTGAKDRALAEKLRAYKESLSGEELDDLVAQTKALLAYQDEETSKEDLEKIPLLQREDLRKEAEPFILEKRSQNGTDILFHDIFTNGVSYIKLLFDITNIDASRLPYLGLLKILLGYVDTKSYSYADLYNEVNIHTGGIVTSTVIYTNAEKTEEYRLFFEADTKVLCENTDKAFALLKEILFGSDLENEKRLLEVVGETKSRLQATMMGSGHTVAALHAMASFSDQAWVQEQIGGISFYRMICDLEKNFAKRKDQVIAKLKETLAMLMSRDRMLADFTGSKEGLESFLVQLESFKECLPDTGASEERLVVAHTGKREAFKSSAGIQYVCRSGSYRKKGLEYTGALRLLKVLMGYEYLWNEVRVKGGAYGCMSNFTRSGDCYFVSYRDPNLKETIDTFEKAADFVADYTADERTITKFIIGALSELDIPKNPSTKGAYALGAYMSRLSYEREQKYRDELLTADADSIRALAAYIRAFMDNESLCVVGNEEKIKACGDLFDKVENLL
ncbi:MAG: insulinase family protein [Lachnospiraceae bacterium]|nr:insulinase family protein [Lachnospiraceae bacterium]